MEITVALVLMVASSISDVTCVQVEVPAATENQGDDMMTYAFDYAVSDPRTGDAKSQWETKQGGVVRGEYSLIDADGSLRSVAYTADSLNGFRANVKVDRSHLTGSSTTTPQPQEVAPPASPQLLPPRYRVPHQPLGMSHTQDALLMNRTPRPQHATPSPARNKMSVGSRKPPPKKVGPASFKPSPPASFNTASYFQHTTAFPIGAQSAAELAFPPFIPSADLSVDSFKTADYGSDPFEHKITLPFNFGDLERPEVHDFDAFPLELNHNELTPEVLGTSIPAAADSGKWLPVLPQQMQVMRHRQRIPFLAPLEPKLPSARPATPNPVSYVYEEQHVHPTNGTAKPATHMTQVDVERVPVEELEQDRLVHPAVQLPLEHEAEAAQAGSETAGASATPAPPATSPAPARASGQAETPASSGVSEKSKKSKKTRGAKAARDTRYSQDGHPGPYHFLFGRRQEKEKKKDKLL